MPRECIQSLLDPSFPSPERYPAVCISCSTLTGKRRLSDTILLHRGDYKGYFVLFGLPETVLLLHSVLHIQDLNFF